VPIDSDPRAVAILHEWVKTTGAEIVRADAREGDIGIQLGEIAKAHPCCAPATRRSLLLPNARSKTCWSERGEHNHVAELALSRRKTGVRVP
jgi:hypothetical protein